MSTEKDQRYPNQPPPTYDSTQQSYPAGGGNAQYVPPGQRYPDAPTNPQYPVVGQNYPQYPPPGQGYPGAQYGYMTTNVVTAQPVGVIIQQPQEVPTTKGYVALGLSIFMCIFCCWPLGIAAIIFAVQSMNEASAGRAAGAHSSGNISLGLSIGGIVCGVIIIILIVVYATGSL